MLKKYIYHTKLVVMNGFSFRVNMIFSQVKHWIFLAIMYFIWSALVENGASDYTLPEIMTYYAIVRILWNLTSPVDFQYAAKLIKSGDLSNLLLKPVDPILNLVFNQMGETIVYWIINAIFSIGFLFILGISPIMPSSIYAFGMFIIVILLARLTVILFNFALSAIGFWVVETKHFHHIIINVVRLVGGSFLPLAMLPGFIQSVAKFLPFQYAISYPINFYLGRLCWTEIIEGTLILFIWIFFLILLNKFLWKLGLRRYEAIGR